MSTRYLVADAVISIKNTRSKGYDSSTILVPYSGLNMSVLKKIEECGYIANVKMVLDGIKKNISVDVKFNQNGLPLVRSVDIVSKPSARVYYTVGQMRHINIRNPFSLVIISTSLGVMTIVEALNRGVGGEAICVIF
jgi:ribosomal protein S8